MRTYPNEVDARASIVKQADSFMLVSFLGAFCNCSSDSTEVSYNFIELDYPLLALYK